jgi:hypothetical protein
VGAVVASGVAALAATAVAANRNLRSKNKNASVCHCWVLGTTAQ